MEKDFGLADGRLTLTVPNALVHYTLQRYQIAITEEDANKPFQFPLQLLNTDRYKLNAVLFHQNAEVCEE